MTEFNDIDDNKLKNNVNERVREAFYRYHQVAQETFQKLLADKEKKHQEVINVLTLQLIESKTERDKCLNKLNDMNELLAAKTKDIEAKKIDIYAKQREIELRDVKIEDINREIEKLSINKIRVTELEAEVIRFSELLSKKEISLGEVYQEIEKLRNVNRSVEEEKHKLFLEKISVEAKLSDIQEADNNKISQIEKQHEIKVSQIQDSYENKISEVTNNFEEKTARLKADYEKNIYDIQQSSDLKLSEYIVKLESLELELQNTKISLQESEKQHLDLKSEKENIEKEYLALKSEKDEIIQQNQKVGFERESLEKQLLELKSKNDELQNTIEITQRDTQESEKILRDEITSLKTMLEESIELAERLLKDKH